MLCRYHRDNRAEARVTQHSSLAARLAARPSWDRSVPGTNDFLGGKIRQRMRRQLCRRFPTAPGTRISGKGNFARIFEGTYQIESLVDSLENRIYYILYIIYYILYITHYLENTLMDQLNVGIVGLGWVAGAHISAFNQIPGAKVTA